MATGVSPSPTERSFHNFFCSSFISLKIRKFYVRNHHQSESPYLFPLKYLNIVVQEMTHTGNYIVYYTTYLFFACCNQLFCCVVIRWCKTRICGYFIRLQFLWLWLFFYYLAAFYYIYVLVCALYIWHVIGFSLHTYPCLQVYIYILESR